MNTKVLLIVGAVALASAGGVLAHRMWPRPVPNLVLESPAGDPVGLDAMFGDKDHLVMVFLLPGCPISKFSLGLVGEQYEAWSGRAAFVGLLFGDQAAADRFKEDEDLDFEVYGLRSAQDPYAVNELIDVVGTSHGTGSAVYGGTVVVIDRDRSVLEQLEKEEVRELPERLRDALE